MYQTFYFLSILPQKYEKTAPKVKKFSKNAEFFIIALKAQSAQKQKVQDSFEFL